MATNCTYIKQNALCKGFHSPLLRARPALKLRTLVNRTAATRTGVSGYNPQVSCQHGRQITRRSSQTYTPEVCTEDDTPKPVSAWQNLASFILKSTAVAALAFALVSPDNFEYFLAINCLLDHGTQACFFCLVRFCCRHLARSCLLRLRVVGVAWEVQALVLQGQAVAHTAGKTQSRLLTCASFADLRAASRTCPCSYLLHFLVVVFCSCLCLVVLFCSGGSSRSYGGGLGGSSSSSSRGYGGSTGEHIFYQ